MARGRSHAIASVGGGLALLAGAPFFYPKFGVYYLACPLGCLVGIVITPDLDVLGSIHAHGVLRHRFGWWVALLFRAFWYPYACLIPHRHWLSHTPIVGTLGRLLYIVILTGGCFGSFLVVDELPLDVAWLLWGLLGLVASDTLHWFMDLF